ncbi:hypothetical protein [Granulicella arctica]|uniref:hypothetical protein n=1 Tax=Granulicella arctica TaxID=940613 RepID=UPI0021DFD8FF|nr:hypothetical protein [Granulicella arctica]
MSKIQGCSNGNYTTDANLCNEDHSVPLDVSLRALKTTLSPTLIVSDAKTSSLPKTSTFKEFRHYGASIFAMRTRSLSIFGVGCSLLLLLVTLDLSATAQVVGYNSKHSANQKSISVSLIQLIYNPERYNGRPIRLIGFLRLEFEGNALYLHREKYEHSLPNGIWIDVPRDLSKNDNQALNNHHVICEGVFRASELEQFRGELTAINRIEVWSFDRR